MVTAADLAAAAEHLEANALRALIETDARLTDRVGIGKAPERDGAGDEPLVPPYVVLFRSHDDDSPESLTATGFRRRPSFNLHATSTTANGADDVLGWVDEILRPGPLKRGVTLAVPGRRCKPIRRLERPGTAEDDSVRPSVWTAIAVYAFESYPLT
jgi:hypothetical protein